MSSTEAEAEADAVLAYVWPHAVQMIGRAAELIDEEYANYSVRFARAVRLTLAADSGHVSDAWAAEQLIRWATDTVPGLLGDLRESAHMAEVLTVEEFAEHLGTAWRWPAGPVRVLQALCVLRPEFAPVARAAHLRRPNPLTQPDPPKEDLT